MGLQSPVSRAVPAGRVARHESRTLRWRYGGGGACASSLTRSPSGNYVVVLAGALGVFPVTEGLAQMRYLARTLEVTAALGLRTSERLDVHAGCAASRRMVPSVGLHVASHRPPPTVRARPVGAARRALALHARRACHVPGSATPRPSVATFSSSVTDERRHSDRRDPRAGPPRASAALGVPVIEHARRVARGCGQPGRARAAALWAAAETRSPAALERERARGAAAHVDAATRRGSGAVERIDAVDVCVAVGPHGVAAAGGGGRHPAAHSVAAGGHARGGAAAARAAASGVSTGRLAACARVPVRQLPRDCRRHVLVGHGAADAQCAGAQRRHGQGGGA